MLELLWQGDFYLWVSETGRKNLCNIKQKHHYKTVRLMKKKKNINYKSIRVQRSAFLLEDKFSLKKEKEQVEDAGQLSG